VIVGGKDNTTAGDYNFVGGGQNVACASGSHNVAAGGLIMSFQGGARYGVIGGGFNHLISTGLYNTIPGGRAITIGNTVGGSFAAGTSVDCQHNNVFMWSDGTTLPASLVSSADNTWRVLASGGSTFFSNSALTTGATLAAGASSWAAVSDRNVKENLVELDSADVLAAVEELPIYAYNYIGSDPDMVCRGPMAQDWHAAFPSAKDPLMIDTMDLDGVTLAAVKGLAARVRAQDRMLEEYGAKFEAQEDRLAALERTLASLSGSRE
jgi:hypothetical protein